MQEAKKSHQIIPFTFRFDASLPYKISPELIHYYEKLCHNITGEKYARNSNLLQAISVPKNGTEKNSLLLGELFRQKANGDYAGYYDDPMNNTFVIDLSSSSKGDKLIYPLLAEIVPKLKKLKKERTEFYYPLFVIILETLNDTRSAPKSVKRGNSIDEVESYNNYDSYYVSLKEYIENGSVCVVGRHNITPCYSWFKKVFTPLDEPPKKTSASKTAYIEKLDFKLIRRIGHFERQSSNACQEFFYDGTYCDKELNQLIEGHIINGCKRNTFNPSYIVFMCPQSLWLKEPLIKACNSLGVLKNQPGFKSINLKHEPINSEDWIKGQVNPTKYFPEVCDVLFIVDFIHDGTAFKTNFEKKIRLHFPNARIEGLSILCTNFAVKKSGREFQTVKKNKIIHLQPNKEPSPIKVHYFLEVEHKVYHQIGNDICPMCRYSLLPRVKSSEPENIKLNSYQMWLMANRAGFEEEPIRTTQGRKQHWLPKINGMLQQNGPYIASKLSENLNHHFPHITDRPKIVVFPDETDNQYHDTDALKDTASGYFAICLKELLGFEYLGLPRDVLHAIAGEGDKWKSNQISIDDVAEMFPDFNEALKKISGDDILVVDEFYSSGTTAKQLLELLTGMGKAAKCFFSLFNFAHDSVVEKVVAGAFQETQLIDLYAFNIKRDE